MRELETEGGRLGSGSGGGGGEERQSTEGTETSSEEALGSLEQLDLLFEKEQGVVRRAGWLSFKPLITLHKDRKLELVPRRKWKHYWVTLKGKAMGISPAVRPRPWCAVFLSDSVLGQICHCNLNCGGPGFVSVMLMGIIHACVDNLMVNDLHSSDYVYGYDGE